LLVGIEGIHYEIPFLAVIQGWYGHSSDPQAKNSAILVLLFRKGLAYLQKAVRIHISCFGYKEIIFPRAILSCGATMLTLVCIQADFHKVPIRL